MGLRPTDGDENRGLRASDRVYAHVQNLGTLLVDADEDGKLDALVADAFGTVWFYHGNGDGTFSTNPSSFSIGDVPFGMAAAP
jgi:hypothetical protein